MKLSTLLEDLEDGVNHQLILRRGALELQTLLMDLDIMDLDVELKSSIGDGIIVKFNDKNNLVYGKIEFFVKYAGNTKQAYYHARTIDGRTIQMRAGGFEANAILFRMFHNDVFFKPFEQSLMSAFGTPGVTSRPLPLSSKLYVRDADKAHLQKDEPYGAVITPPFKLESYSRYGSGPAIMVHDTKIIQALTVCITRRGGTMERPCTKTCAT